MFVLLVMFALQRGNKDCNIMSTEAARARSEIVKRFYPLRPAPHSKPEEYKRERAKLFAPARWWPQCAKNAWVRRTDQKLAERWDTSGLVTSFNMAVPGQQHKCVSLPHALVRGDGKLLVPRTFDEKLLEDRNRWQDCEGDHTATIDKGFIKGASYNGWQFHGPPQDDKVAKQSHSEAAAAAGVKPA
jgi:hypothetical protein